MASLEQHVRRVRVAPDRPSERSGLCEPDALEAEPGVLEDQVVVAVVVEHAAARHMSAGGDHQIRRRYSMVAHSSEFVLRVESSMFDSAVDREIRRCPSRLIISRWSSAAQAEKPASSRKGRHVASLPSSIQSSTVSLAILGNPVRHQSRPGGLVHQNVIVVVGDKSEVLDFLSRLEVGPRSITRANPLGDYSPRLLFRSDA